MKNLQQLKITVAFSLLFILNISYSQTVITTKGDTITDNIKSILSGRVNYYHNVDKIDDDEILLEDVSEIIGIEKRSRIRTIHNYNPYILIKRDVNDSGFRATKPLADIQNNSASQPSAFNLQLSSGDYLQRAGRRYYTGLGFTLGGSVLTIAAANEGNEAMMLMGVTSSLTGLIISLTGPAQLIKAGKRLNIELSRNGLAMKF
ncbi:MAG: hypothetical protein ACOCVA_04605 [Prolixibacteraceae bacterium]